jgi:hypothetical protein
MKKSCLASFALFLSLLFTLPARGDVWREIEPNFLGCSHVTWPT